MNKSLNFTWHKVLLLIIVVVILLLGTVAACAIKVPETTSPVLVPADPNDSIVIAKVINIHEGEGSLPWVLIFEIQTSQNVPGFPNRTADKIGQQLLVRTEENLSQLKVSQIITAHVRFEGDERSSFYFAWDIHSQ